MLHGVFTLNRPGSHHRRFVLGDYTSEPSARIASEELELLELPADKRWRHPLVETLHKIYHSLAGARASDRVYAYADRHIFPYIGKNTKTEQFNALATIIIAVLSFEYPDIVLEALAERMRTMNEGYASAIDVHFPGIPRAVAECKHNPPTDNAALIAQIVARSVAVVMS